MRDRAPVGEIVAALIVGGLAALGGCLAMFAWLARKASEHMREQMP